MSKHPPIDPNRMYRATSPLMIGRSRAANPGDLIHGETVSRWPDWHDKVEAVDETERPNGGVVEDILARVGSDPEQARAAYEEELRANRPRKTLVEALAPLAGIDPHTTATTP